jgi:urease accessory protein
LTAVAAWDARLRLGFDRVGARSVMTHREHRGPLVVQKPLYPEGPAVCQCVLVHPPAGIAGGDRLAIDARVERGACVQLTTPGATRWYRSAGATASQTVDLDVGEEATLEWLPQGTIVYEGAYARSELRIRLARTATFIGAEFASLGRRASGERFRCGEWRQRFEIVRDDALIWSERAVLKGDSGVLAASAGLNGAPVFGTFVAVGAPADDSLIATLRALTPRCGEAAVTRLPDVLVARYRGESMESAGAYFGAVWSTLRPALTGRVAVRPRIWST